MKTHIFYEFQLKSSEHEIHHFNFEIEINNKNGFENIHYTSAYWHEAIFAIFKSDFW